MNRYLLAGLLLVASACGGPYVNGIYHRLNFTNPTVVALDAPTVVGLYDSGGRQRMEPVSLTCTPGPCDVSLQEGMEPAFIVTPRAEGRHTMVAIVRAPQSDALIADEYLIEAVALSGITLTMQGFTSAVGPLELIRSGEGLLLCVEARQPKGQSINPSAATFSVDHEEVLQALAQQPGVTCRTFKPVGHGVATVVATFGVHTASVEVRVFDPSRTRSLALQEVDRAPDWKPLGVPLSQLSMVANTTRTFQVLGIADDGRQAQLSASCFNSTIVSGTPLTARALVSQLHPGGLLQLTTYGRGVATLAGDPSCSLPRGLTFRVTVD